MKGKLKLIILLMLVLLLVACGNATPSSGGVGTGTGSGIAPTPGGGTTQKTAPEEDEGAFSFINSSGMEDIIGIKNGHKVVYNADLFKNKLKDKYPGKKIEDIGLRTSKGSHLEFTKNVVEIKFKNIENLGNMYFIDKVDESREYLITFPGDDNFFDNDGNIYVMDGNRGSTLKIDGNYSSTDEIANIHLGLYASEDGKNFSTDKVHITGEAHGKTKVNFVYEKEKVKLHEDAKYDGEDYVIKVGGIVNAPGGGPPKGTFIMEDSIPVGTKVLQWNCYKETGAHLWKLENMQ